jgi:TonB family protein
MTKIYKQQKKALLLASLISLSIHGGIILTLTGALQGDKINLVKKLAPIKVELVEIKTEERPKLPTILKPKAKASIQKKAAQPIRQLKPPVAKQNTFQKPKGDQINRKRSATPISSVEQGSKKQAILTTSNPTGNTSLRQSTSPTLSKQKTSIIPKETPRCRQCREPRIPRRAEQRGEEGYATFRLYISASGKVIETQLLKSSGHSGFINSARKAAMTSTFHPMAQKNTKDIMYVMKTNNK